MTFTIFIRFTSNLWCSTGRRLRKHTVSTRWIRSHYLESMISEQSMKLVKWRNEEWQKEIYILQVGLLYFLLARPCSVGGPGLRFLPACCHGRYRGWTKAGLRRLCSRMYSVSLSFWVHNPLPSPLAMVKDPLPPCGCGWVGLGWVMRLR